MIQLYGESQCNTCNYLIFRFMSYASKQLQNMRSHPSNRIIHRRQAARRVAAASGHTMPPPVAGGPPAAKGGFRRCQEMSSVTAHSQ